jgi:hypothetical protein
MANPVVIDFLVRGLPDVQRALRTTERVAERVTGDHRRNRLLHPAGEGIANAAALAFEGCGNGDDDQPRHGEEESGCERSGHGSFPRFDAKPRKDQFVPIPSDFRAR